MTEKSFHRHISHIGPSACAHLVNHSANKEEKKLSPDARESNSRYYADCRWRNLRIFWNDEEVHRIAIDNSHRAETDCLLMWAKIAKANNKRNVQNQHERRYSAGRCTHMNAHDMERHKCERWHNGTAMTTTKRRFSDNRCEPPHNFCFYWSWCIAVASTRSIITSLGRLFVNWIPHHTANEPQFRLEL